MRGVRRNNYGLLCLRELNIVKAPQGSFVEMSPTAASMWFRKERTGMLDYVAVEIALGVLIPLFILLRRKISSTAIVSVASTLVLVGVFTYVIIIGGQVINIERGFGHGQIR